MMLQQTQASHVVSFYHQWLKNFPTFTVLASASTADVLRAWSGLGYNNRALRIHQTAKQVVTKYRGRLPRDIETLQTLPGIGKYSSHAICCFAFHHTLPVVDVNIKRIYTRVSKRVKSAGEMVSEQKAWEIAEKILPAKSAYHWNQALMDLGALVCTARNPRCLQCPLQTFCKSASLPIFLTKEKKAKKNEPSYRGIPRRLYRGKILKLLHNHAFTGSEIAQLLWKNVKPRDVEWLHHVMGLMEKDGLIRLQKQTYRIA
ncbi:MAG: hypothetical protein PHP42_08310 [Bacteroidota bacterium]|nr:hypothetical protein [Bacteroidota bacterium]